MDTILTFLTASMVIGLGLAGFRQLFGLHRGVLTAANTTYGGSRLRHAQLKYTLDAAVSQRYLLAKAGSAEAYADICTATDTPIGYYDDEGAIGDVIAIQRGSTETFFGIGAVAISVDDWLYTAAGGKVTNVPVIGCKVVGRALTAVGGSAASAGGDSAIVEYEPIAFGTPGDAGLSSSVAVANTGTPDGVGHATGQVSNQYGDAIAGSFAIHFWSAATDLALAADLGDLAAAANSVIIGEDTTDASGWVRTHTDGSWGLDFNMTSDGNLYVMVDAVVAVTSDGTEVSGN